MTTEKYFTLVEAAALLKYNRRSIYRWIKQGKLKASKIGGDWRIKENDLNAIIQVIAVNPSHWYKG